MPLAEATARSAPWRRNRLLQHLLKVVVLLLSAVGRLSVVWWTVGLLNRRLFRLEAVFFCYAGSERYARHYCYAWSESWLRAVPTLIGVYRVGRAWGLAFASPATADELVGRDTALLDSVLSRLGTISRLVRATHIRLAGVIPGHLHRIGHPLGATEIGDVVANAVFDATCRTLPECGLPDSTPVVVLGGGGFVGQRVVGHLQRAGLPHVVVDPARGRSAIPQQLERERVLVLDMSRPGGLRVHVERIPPGSVVLSEVFPEPDRADVLRLKRMNCRVLHIAGVGARVYPSLPGSYAGAVPCCAILDDGVAGLVIRDL